MNATVLDAIKTANGLAARVLAQLEAGRPMTSQQLADAMERGRAHTNVALRELRAAGFVRIAAWQQSPRKAPAPMYGRVTSKSRNDAPHPKPPVTHCAARPAPGTVAAELLASLRREPGQTAAALADELGKPANHVSAVLQQMRARELVRIVGWATQCDYSPGNRPRRLWAKGRPKDEPPPPARLTPHQIRQRQALRRRPAATTPASVFHLGAIIARELQP